LYALVIASEVEYKAKHSCSSSVKGKAGRWVMVHLVTKKCVQMDCAQTIVPQIGGG
jgi:hypothetical protein